MSAARELAGFDERLGAFARIYDRNNLDALADAFVIDELRQVQLNLTAIGLPTLPSVSELESINLADIAGRLRRRGLTLWGLSATYNLAHPDVRRRRESNVVAAAYIRAMRPAAPVAATLSTGTRDPIDTWRHHPDNADETAWHDMRESLDVLLPAAAEAGVVLGIEPEPGNIVSDTDAALRLIRELGGDAVYIGIVLDAANLVSTLPHSAHAATLDRAFAELGEHTVCLHAKDTVPWAQTLEGGGVVNYDHVLALSDALPKPVPLIIQDATEDQIPVLRDRLRRARLAVA